MCATCAIVRFKEQVRVDAPSSIPVTPAIARVVADRATSARRNPPGAGVSTFHSVTCAGRHALDALGATSCGEEGFARELRGPAPGTAGLGSQPAPCWPGAWAGDLRRPSHAHGERVIAYQGSRGLVPLQPRQRPPHAQFYLPPLRTLHPPQSGERRPRASPLGMLRMRTMPFSCSAIAWHHAGTSGARAAHLCDGRGAIAPAS